MERHPVARSASVPTFPALAPQAPRAPRVPSTARRTPRPPAARIFAPATPVLERLQSPTQRQLPKPPPGKETAPTGNVGAMHEESAGHEAAQRARRGRGRRQSGVYDVPLGDDEASRLFCRMLVASAGSLSPLCHSPRVRRLFSTYTGQEAPGELRASSRRACVERLGVVPRGALSSALISGAHE